MKSGSLASLGALLGACSSNSSFISGMSIWMEFLAAADLACRLLDPCPTPYCMPPINTVAWYGVDAFSVVKDKLIVSVDIFVG